MSYSRKKRKAKHGKSNFNHSTYEFGRSFYFDSLSCLRILRPKTIKWTNTSTFGIRCGRYGANFEHLTPRYQGFGLTDIPLNHGETRLRG